LGTNFSQARDINDLGDIVGQFVGDDGFFHGFLLSKGVLTTLDFPGAREAIDAGGLGLLVFLHTCAHGLGTELKLRNPTQHVAELLKLTNLDSVFEIFSPENVSSRHATVSRAIEDIRNVIVHEF
jgi:hypothetical protein